ncbi:LOW QUALITY PROTEIN: probable polygalacturonase [Phalaenopsis equestris]|uniref:LOW QUALITY PROTEIN: probable polygalacturonase n=1 Tax=Phalaenopsis equestris TaxID=78828 RepID=UPI0009E2DA5A|nr:LOW QUALITY PROTEIN: probable polygalacturonase [Phalaenopsis equestris]
MELLSRSFTFSMLPMICLLVMAAFSRTAECRFQTGSRVSAGVGGPAAGERKYEATSCRTHTASLTDFGGVGDGATLNTKAFREAVAHLAQFSGDGGGLLYVPAGRWLTGPFNLTSYMTLFLHRNAVILATQDINEWPIIDPLPSYGRGRDAPGGRFTSFIMGSNLTDVIITGDNGTIDGQGSSWWAKFHHKQLKYTRGYLVELQHSDQIFISNLVFLNSPSWNIHPVYSSNIIVKGITISAPVNSPNTDGINPDSCSQVRIEDSYIVSGDDCVAIKSGWDEYGIAVGRPSEHIIIRRLTCVSPTSATIALGSEMSGGIQDVRAEDITAVDTESGVVRTKPAVGRGGFVRDVFVRRMTLNTMKWAFWMTGNYNSHPDGKYNPDAIPDVEGINYSHVVAENVTTAGRLEGIERAPFKGICMSNVTVEVRKAKKAAWVCENVEGVASGVTPAPCDAFKNEGIGAAQCPFREERLPIEEVEVRACTLPLSYSV